MSSQQVVLFDLPTRPPVRAWSYNPWKTRLVLNYKGIDYRTEWTEYPDIKPRLESHLPGLEEYTIPTVILPGGEYVMDSLKIAEALERAFPTPSLHLDSPYVGRVVAALSGAQTALRGVYVPLVLERLIGGPSRAYFAETRDALFGMPLAQVAREQGGDAAFAAAAPHLRAASALLAEDPAGPFFAGAAPGYADLVWAAALLFYRTIGDDVLRKLLDASGDPERHLKLLEALRPWSERDDH